MPDLIEKLQKKPDSERQTIMIAAVIICAVIILAGYIIFRQFVPAETIVQENENSKTSAEANEDSATNQNLNLNINSLDLNINAGSTIKLPSSITPKYSTNSNQ